ncbi:MAG: hypothetical protein E7206_09035 [Clostridium beijerinckii]|nr:hypothetical protein [Clostridium beijerinckii]
MSINKIEMQDDKGNTYYPHTDASIVKYGDSDVSSVLSYLTNKSIDTAWMGLPLLNGVTNYTIYTLRYRRIGKLIQIQGFVTNIGVINTIIATLPVGFRPSQSLVFVGAKNGYNTIMFSIEQNGNVIFWGATNNVYNTADYVGISAEFLID